MQNSARLVLVFVLLGAVAWLVFRTGGRSAESPVGARERPTPERVLPVELAPLPGSAGPGAADGGASEAARTEAAPPAADVAVPVPSAIWRVHGTVTDTAAFALPRARVWTWDTEVECDERGAYELVIQHPRGQIQLFASAPGHTETEQTFTFPAGQREVRIDVRLGPAFVVRGTVSDAEGRPVGGARVTSFYSRKAEATSAPDGSFELDSLDPGRNNHSLFARKEGYVQAATVVATQGLLSEGVSLVLRRGTPVEGFVLGPGGVPLAGVALYIGFSPHAQDRLDATTDGRGAFSFPNVDHGPRTLVAQLAGYSAQRLVLDVPKEPPGLPALELHLEPARWVGGTVRDVAGKTLAGVAMSGKQNGEYLELVTVHTDELGRFRVEGLPAVGAGLEFHAPGVVRRTVELASEQLDRDDLVVVLERSARVAGLVVDADTRRPVERFTVHFLRPQLEPGEQEIMGYSARWVREGRPFATPDGTWTSGEEALRPGALVGIEVRAEGYAPARHRRVVARPDFAPTELVFELAPGGAVVGVVLGPGDMPVAGAQVFASAAGDSVRRGAEDQYRSGYTTTASDGRFALAHVPPGPTKLTVFATGPSPTIDGPFDVTRGGEVERTVRLGAGATLRVRVLDASGAPLVGVRVLVTELDRSGGPTSAIQLLPTDAAGEARFEDLTPGLYLIAQLHRDGGRSGPELQTERVLRADAAVTVHLQPTGDVVLRGRVTRADGEPVPVLLVFATFSPFAPDFDAPAVAAPPASMRGVYTEAGEFRFTGLERGLWILHATLDTDGRTWQGFQSVDLTAGPVAPVTLRLE